MKREIRFTAVVLAMALMAPLCVCAEAEDSGTSDREYIEKTLNLANNEDQEWTYSADADAWVLSPVLAVAYPELPQQQGVSVCVPGAYVTGIDTDGDGAANIAAENISEAENVSEAEDVFEAKDVSEAVKGSLVIDYDAQITSTNGQVYTAATAPVILNTGAAGYGSQSNQAASAVYAADGYINVSCGNRGKQDSVTDDDGNTSFTGDAPSCLVDQKAAARYVKYNILLGNLPGNVDYLVSTGGSGGGAHASMFAATSDHPDYYDYQIEAGAVGVYKNEDGSYSTTVTINGEDYELSDGAWGCVAYSAITSLYEADMALAFEYYLDPEYSFKTPFQKQLAGYLSESYMDYINGKNLSVEESDVGFDLDGDGKLDSTVALTIEYDPENHADTNGYYGTYLDLYLAEFTQNLQWYLDNLDYAQDWTWFDEDGNALSDDAVAAMTGEEKARAFVEGRYAKGSAGFGGMGGGFDGAFPKGKMPDGDGIDPVGKDGDVAGFGDGQPGDGQMLPALPDGEQPDGMGDELAEMNGDFAEMGGGPGGAVPDGKMPGGRGMFVGTPDGGTTQSATGSGDTAVYESYADMVAAYKADIQEVYEGDRYGNNIVSLYNPLNYIGADDTSDPVWTKIVMGASEGDMSMFSSLNLQIAWLNAGVDAVIEWQWDGGHVPSEILGNSFSLYVDQMYGKYVEGAVAIEKAAATKQTANGTAETATGTDISGWVNDEDTTAVSFSLSDAAAYRTKGASKAMPGFDVIDYGQEDYVFGSAEKDARHWDTYLLDIFEEHADALEPLFSVESGESAEELSAEEELSPDEQADGGQTPPALPDGEQPGDGQTPPALPNGEKPGDMGGEQPGGMGGGQPGGFGGSGEVTQGTAANTLAEDGTYNDFEYTSSGDDENALRIDGATATLEGITVEKSAGKSSNTEDGDFYGMNAALLATNGATVTIKNASVSSSAQNGNGVFSYGSGTTVNISDSTITTTADNSGGIQTTGGGTTNAENLTVETSGNSSAAIRSDRGGGTVNVDGGSYTTNGYNSPAVYSTAAITVKNAALTANNSEALVIEGKNSIALENCTVIGNMSDTKGSSSDENVHNVMIYQSMSGDADVGTSEFTMTGGMLISENGDMFYVTNTHCAVNLCGVELVNQDSDAYLLNVSGNSASRGWGTAGANGGQVEFTATDQTMNGDIIVDTVSTLNLTLAGNSDFTGTINIVDNAQGGAAVGDNAVVTVESGSVWTLTGDCSLTSLTNQGTIDFNGYTITLADGTMLREE